MPALTYELALGMFYPTTIWESAAQNVYEQIQYISGPALPSKAQLDADIASYSFSGGQLAQFAAGTVPAISGTVQVPYDSTAPLVTEGFELWNRTISKSSAASIIQIMVMMTVDHSKSKRYVTASLFRDNTNIGSTVVYFASSNCPQNVSLQAVDTPAVVGNVTYSMRIGADDGGTTYVNISSTGLTLGSTMPSSYSIMEIV